MPTKSLYPTVDIPNVDIWTLLFNRKDRQFPDNKIIYQDAETGRSYTYEQVRSTALEFGTGLKANWEWKKGDVLAVFSPNSIDIPPLTWGTHWAGGVVSPANPAYTADELAFQLKGTKARVLATQMSCLSTAIEAAKRVGIPDDRIILIGDERHPTSKYKHFTTIQNISRSIRYAKTKVDPAKDLAFLVYSSGTTGVPKGVMLSHKNIVTNIHQLKAGEEGNLTWNGRRRWIRLLAFLPFYHIYGLTCLVHNALFSGLHLVVMAKFDIERWCSHVQNYRITFSYIVPPVVLLLTKHPVVDKYDLSSLRMMNSGAAPLTRELVESTYARIKCGIKQGYGLSETSPTTHTVPWSDWRRRAGSVGKLLPNMEAKYMTSPEDDSEPQEVPVGEVGELYIRGPNVFLGYLDNPAATAACVSPDGWFRTGDVGYQDSEGFFYITDRVKELIKYKGFQVAPAELEGLLTDHEAVSDAAVIGVESAENGTEVPRAYIVPNPKIIPPGRRTAEEGERISQWLQTRVAPYKRLRGGVRFVDEIPKSASGKILRRLLKEEAKKEEVIVKAKL
ncbi:LOW QUALITY PROTEIN: 4-coumarate-CoA ligase [Coccidioides immitis RMSCC 3703]|uniref:4-coumarate-CoA ligase n=1 Tax=Coccidioides immitis RMSCC 3703 TaxID=454286 RepID=A0A0J8QXA3_COCIT|nr:LOW QUALITY PROTEIN: 4-coumarate-CoA ligase [Coccidioides immitis RMSCC 3703]